MLALALKAFLLTGGNKDRHEHAGRVRASGVACLGDFRQVMQVSSFRTLAVCRCLQALGSRELQDCFWLKGKLMGPRAQLRP